MAKRFEQWMRQGMQSVGQVVEKAIGKAQAAKATMVTGGGLASPPALETHLGVPKLKTLLTLAAERLIPPLLPSLGGRTALEIAEGGGKFALTLKERGAPVVAMIEMGGGNAAITTDTTRHLYVIRAHLRRLPFADGAFDFCVANLATPQQGDFARALKEISRVVAADGRIVIADFHPFGAYTKRGTQRLKPAESTFRGVADYFKLARLAGLTILDIREAFIDETLRALFATPEEKTVYRALKDTPLMVCLVARKGVGDER